MKHKFKKMICASALALSLAAGLGAVPMPSYASEGHGKHAHGHDHEGEDAHAEEGGHAEGQIILSAAQIAAAKIEISAAAHGGLALETIVPGRITTAADRMAQVVPKASGTVFEVRKNLGDRVEKGEVIALIESREMAETAAEYLAARRSAELAQTVYKREKGLWNKKITAEQDFQTAKNNWQEADIRLDLAKQKLHALGYDSGKIAANNTRFHEMKSPIAGSVIVRELTLGEYVDTTRAGFTVADLSVVWAEVAISLADLSFVQEGQAANIQGDHKVQAGQIVFVSPAVDAETRTAKAIVTFDNADGTLKPGQFVSIAIATSAQQAGVVVPKSALQTIEGRSVVFVRTENGFEKHEVTTGREDSRNVEIVSGLDAGVPIATTGTFRLKAELGKSEAGHEH